MNFSNLNESDWQNFAYIVLLLIFMVPRFLSREMPFAKTLKYISLWGFAALFFVSLHAYRYHLLEFKDEIFSAINPTKPKTNKSGQIIIKIAEDGHFYINTKINDFDVRFMIDTGASDVVISQNEAKRIGFDFKKLNFNKIYQTANGKTYGASIIIDEMWIADKRFEKVNASINKSEMGQSLLGMSFLKRFKKYEFYREELILEP